MRERQILRGGACSISRLGREALRVVPEWRDGDRPSCRFEVTPKIDAHSSK